MISSGESIKANSKSYCFSDWIPFLRFLTVKDEIRNPIDVDSEERLQKNQMTWAYSIPRTMI